MAFKDGARNNSGQQKTPPPDDTHKEAAYLKSLGERKEQVSIKLMDGEVVRGWVEYYDRRMVRLTREGAPNLFIFKHEIAYIAEENVSSPKPDKNARGDTPARSR